MISPSQTIPRTDGRGRTRVHTPSPSLPAVRRRYRTFFGSCAEGARARGRNLLAYRKQRTRSLALREIEADDERQKGQQSGWIIRAWGCCSSLPCCATG